MLEGSFRSLIRQMKEHRQSPYDPVYAYGKVERPCTCGCDAVLDYANGFFVRCTNPNCFNNYRPPNYVSMFDSSEEAIRYWSRHLSMKMERK